MDKTNLHPIHSHKTGINSISGGCVYTLPILFMIPTIFTWIAFVSTLEKLISDENRSIREDGGRIQNDPPVISRNRMSTEGDFEMIHVNKNRHQDAHNIFSLVEDDEDDDDTIEVAPEKVSLLRSSRQQRR